MREGNLMEDWALNCWAALSTLVNAEGSGTVATILEYIGYETALPCGGGSVFGINGRFVGFLSGLNVVVAVSGE